MDKEHYTEVFLENVKEYLQNICSCMMILDQEPENKDCIQEIRFSLHLIKGMAGTMGFLGICRLTEDMEEIFFQASGGGIRIRGRLMDVLKECVDALKTYTENIEKTSLEGEYDDKILRQELKQASEGMKVNLLPEQKTPREQSVPESNRKEAEDTNTAAKLESGEKTEMVLVETVDLKDFSEPLGELVMVKNRLELLCNSKAFAFKNRVFLEQMEYFKHALTKLQESADKIRMISLEEITCTFRKKIRTAAVGGHKRIDLYMSGLDCRIDRISADTVKEILWYLLGSTAQYGMDGMAVRRRQGKSPKGSIYLNAHSEYDSVVIQIHDDGNGTDISRQKEMENGRNLNQARIEIEKLGGELTASFEPLKGSKYRIRIPFPAVTLHAFAVDVHEEIYVLDMKYVQYVEDIQGTEMFDENGNVIPLIYIDQRLGIQSKKKETENKKAVVVKKGSKSAGLVIDAAIGYQEAVIRPLGSFVQKNPLIGGAVILKDGRPSLVFDINMWI